jgi:hypothetical protein
MHVRGCIWIRNPSKRVALVRAVNGIDYAGFNTIKILKIFIRDFKFEEARFKIAGCACNYRLIQWRISMLYVLVYRSAWHTLHLKKHHLHYRTNTFTRSCGVKAIFTSLVKDAFIKNVPICVHYTFRGKNSNILIRQTTFLITMYELKKSLVRRTLLA